MVAEMARLTPYSYTLSLLNNKISLIRDFIVNTTQVVISSLDSVP